MYHNKRITKKLEQYIPATKIFEEFSQEAGIAFLDSSLINELGSILSSAENLTRY